MLSSVIKFSLASVTKRGGTLNCKKASASVNINSPASVNNVKSGAPPPLGTPLAVEGRPALNDRSIANILHFVGYNRTTRKCDSGYSAIDCGIGG